MKSLLINLDLKSNGYNEIELKQGCNDTLIATITDLGEVVDLIGQVISIEMMKADNTFIIQSNDIVVLNNTITIKLNTDLTRVSGKGKLQIKMTKDSTVNGSWVVNVKIKKSAIDEAIGESANIVTIKETLDNTITQAIEENAKTENLIATGGAATKGEVVDIMYNALTFNSLSFAQIKGDGSDETLLIQNLLDSVPNGSIIKFPKTSQFYGVTSGIQLNLRNNIKIISNGGEIRYINGTTDAFYNAYPNYAKDSIFRLINCDNIVFDGIKLNGNISNRTAYLPTESFNSNISILGSSNIKLVNCNITEAMTDGVFISKDSLSVLSKDIIIDNCTITKCRRNNISLVGQKGVIISNTLIDSAGTIQGINPQSGIDIEPELLGESSNISFKNNIVSNNAGQYAFSCGAKGTDNLKIINNVFDSNSQFALNLNSTSGFNNINVSVEGNTFKNHTTQSALRIVGKNCDIVSKNTFINNLYGIQCISIDGLIVTSNKFVKNLYGGIIATTFVNLKVNSNVFEDNSSATGETNLLGYCLNGTITDATSVIQFNDNLAYTNSIYTYKQRGAKINTSCNSFASGNMFKNLFDNIQCLQNFKYRGSNNSTDASAIYQNIVGDMNFTGGGGNLYVGDKKHGYGTTMPTTGIWSRGDIIYNTSPAANGYMGWTCITGGDFTITPPVFKGFGLIQS